MWVKEECNETREFIVSYGIEKKEKNSFVIIFECNLFVVSVDPICELTIFNQAILVHIFAL